MSAEKIKLTPQQKKKLLLQIFIPVLAVVLVLGIILIGVHFGTKTVVLPGAGFTMPILTLEDIGGTRQYIDGYDEYKAHPDIVETDTGNLIMMYPTGHGRGPLVTQVSTDFGATWTEKTDTPDSWDNSQETPTLYNVKFVDSNGVKNGDSALILISGCPDWPIVGNWQDRNGFNSSVSTDDGATWTEFKNWYGQEWAGGKSGAYDAIVAMSSLTQLKEDGKYINKWMGTFHDRQFHTYKTFLTFAQNEDGTLKVDENGRYVEQWSEPESLLGEYRKHEKKSSLCEIEIIRTPNGDGSSLDGDMLIGIARANSRRTYSMIFTSTDEGKTWSEPKELPVDLNGDRHKAEYDPVSKKLVISYRQITAYKASALAPRYTNESLGWIAWVGTFDQLLDDGIGDALLLLGSSNGDCGYSGTAWRNGEFVMASYGLFSADYVPSATLSATTQPYAYIMSVKFTTAGIYAALGE